MLAASRFGVGTLGSPGAKEHRHRRRCWGIVVRALILEQAAPDKRIRVRVDQPERRASLALAERLVTVT
jgi:hypothetical protein